MKLKLILLSSILSFAMFVVVARVDAAQNGDLAAVQQELDMDADVNSVHNGNTALIWAAREGCANIGSGCR